MVYRVGRPCHDRPVMRHANEPRVVLVDRAVLVPFQLNSANTVETLQRVPADAELAVAVTQVAIAASLAAGVIRVVGVGERRALERAELRLDEVEPGGLGRGEHRGDAQAAQQRQEARAVVDVPQVVEHDEKAPARVADPQAPEGLGHLGHAPAPTEDPAERSGVHVIEGQQRAGAATAVIGRTHPGRLAPPRPDRPARGSQLQRPELVEADHSRARRAALVEPADGPPFSSKRGSVEPFQVFTRWALRPSRRKRRRTHSSLMSGSTRFLRQYAASLATDQLVYGSPRSLGLESAISTSSRSCSGRMIAGRPFGLVASSKVRNPDSLKRRTQAYARVKWQPARSAASPIDRRSRRARRLPLHPGVRLGAALQRVGVSDLRARHQPERSPRDHAARAAARAGGDRAFEPQRARAAVHQLVGGQARGVLPKETGAARHQRGAGAPPFAPRGPQCPAGEDLEGLDRPALRRKRGAIRRLYERRPPRARVICFDEFGPLELRPAGGSVWARRREPARVRATYHRGGGTRTLLAFYDVHAGALGGIFRRRRRVAEVAEAFRRLRACYPRWRLFVVLDNLRHIHDSPRFLALLRRVRITPVFTPTEASWLNLIEAQFGALKRATLTNTDDPDHASRQRRSYRDLRYRHRELGIRGHALERLHSIRGIKLERH